MNQTLVASIQVGMLDKLKASFAAWWKRNICDDFDAHYPNEPWLFDYEVVIGADGKKYFVEH